MVYKAITHVYTQDDIPNHKVVGIFEPSKLAEAIKDIKVGFGSDKELIDDIYDNSCGNYFLSFKDECNSWFYTSDYTLNELDL